MHYKNGREAKVGDRVVGKDYNGVPIAGVVVAANAGSDTCNLYVVPTRPSDQVLMTAKEVMHMDDALSVGADPVAPGGQ